MIFHYIGIQIKLQKNTNVQCEIKRYCNTKIYTKYLYKNSNGNREKYKWKYKEILMKIQRNTNKIKRNTNGNTKKYKWK